MGVVSFINKSRGEWENGGRDGIPISRPVKEKPPLAPEFSQPQAPEGSGSLPRETLLLIEKARKRLHRMASNGMSWHAGSSISVFNILATLLTHWVPEGAARGIDRRIVLSKGHASIALYALLAEMNLLKEEPEKAFAKPGSPIQPHPEAGKVPGVPVSTGSLGQGLSVANGMAFAARLDGVERQVAVILGDGELDEGQVWEAAATTVSLGLSNVIAIVDKNGFQNTGETSKVKKKEPLSERWRGFGWHVIELDTSSIEALAKALAAAELIDKPVAIIVDTSRELRKH